MRLGFLFLNMINKIRYKLCNTLFGNKELLKAIALVLYSYHVNKTNVIKKYNAHKLSVLTKVSHKTVEKRVKTILDNGFASIEKGNLIFKSIVSKHKERNISLDKVNFASLKDVEKSLYGILLVIIQSRKDFCKSTIRRATDGRNYKEVKSAKLMLRKCCYKSEYREFGLSYHRIADFFGVSISSAFSYVRYAIKQGMIRMSRNFKSFYLPSVNKREVYGFTFTTKNYGYLIGANIYNIIS